MQGQLHCSLMPGCSVEKWKTDVLLIIYYLKGREVYFALIKYVELLM